MTSTRGVGRASNVRRSNPRFSRASVRQAFAAGDSDTDVTFVRDARELKLVVRAMGSAELAAIRGVKPGRALQLDDAAALLAALVGVTDPSEVIISAHGLREGLLFEALDPKLRKAM